MKTAFVDFYNENQISPVRQDISDLQLHYARRNNLYRLLGIVPSFLNNKSIIEFGPGSGHNALYSLFLCPKKYVFVDGSPTGLQETRKNIEKMKTNIDIQYYESLIENFRMDETFDIVFCEGVLPGQVFPQNILKKISKFVAVGGVLVITTVCEVSYLSESLRKIYGFLKAPKKLLINQRVALLFKEMERHLNTLEGRSRFVSDWILDSMIQPFIGNFFSFSDAINVLVEEFEFLGSSPSFVNEWHWYKQLPLGIMRNKVAIEEFKRNTHNFLDYRYMNNSINIAEGDIIRKICKNIVDAMLEFECEKKTIENLIQITKKNLEDIIPYLQGLPLTQKGILEFLEFLANPHEQIKFQDFASFWGRGQQYLSFVKMR